MSYSTIRKLEFKDILELTREVDGSTLESLNESFSPYLELDYSARLEQSGEDKLMATGYIFGTPRAVPLYIDLEEKTVSISIWETIKSIVSHKNMLIGYVPLEFSMDLRNKLVKVEFMDYKLVYGNYEKRLLDFVRRKNNGGPAVFRSNTYVLKEK